MARPRARRFRFPANATILVPADTATVRLGVTESAQNVLEAQSAMNAKIEAIRQALLESGIDEKSINTDRLNIYTNYSYAGRWH